MTPWRQNVSSLHWRRFIEQLPQWIPEEELPKVAGMDEEQLKEQGKVPEEPPPPRPPGQNNQYFIVMRHGERIDEVRCVVEPFAGLASLFCIFV